MIKIHQKDSPIRPSFLLYHKHILSDITTENLIEIIVLGCNLNNINEELKQEIRKLSQVLIKQYYFQYQDIYIHTHTHTHTHKFIANNFSMKNPLRRNLALFGNLKHSVTAAACLSIIIYKHNTAYKT